MLEKLRKAISPASISAEIVHIEEELGPLDAEREQRRLAAGHLVLSKPELDFEEKQTHRRHHARIAEIDERTMALRTRRQELLELLKPEPVAKTALVDVPMSPELVAAFNELETARARRQSLIAERWNDTSEASEKRRAVRIAEAEAEIDRLRRRREDLLVPYNEALWVALDPLIYAQAERLDRAAGQFLDALQELRGIDAVYPRPAVGGNSVIQSLLFDMIVSNGTAQLFRVRETCQRLLGEAPATEGAAE